MQGMLDFDRTTRAKRSVLIVVAVVALSATHSIDARTHHRKPKITAATATTNPEAKMPIETKRDPADIALDRKIKGICRGC
jgi:hypothetical protein